MHAQINSAPEVIAVLGGPTAVGKLFDVRPNAVSQWKTRGFPPETYVALMAALAEKGFSAPASLWQMRKPQQAAE